MLPKRVNLLLVHAPPSISSKANLKNVSDQVNSVVTNAEQESFLSQLLQKVTRTQGF